MDEFFLAAKCAETQVGYPRWLDEVSFVIAIRPFAHWGGSSGSLSEFSDVGRNSDCAFANRVGRLSNHQSSA
jgi:hypothetical protein